jgi:hypothetical protein
VSPWSRLARAAWIAVATHALAGLAMLLVLRQGLETNPDLDARLRFVAEHRAAWIGAWLVWNAAAVSILYFCVAFAAAHRGDAHHAGLSFGVALCGAAIACDLGAESILMGLLPYLAADRGTFVVWERAAILLTGYVANGLYTGAILTLVVASRRAYAVHATAVGLLMAAAGIALSAAALLGSVSGMFWTNAVLLPSLLLWLALVARDAAQRERRSG